MRLGLGHIGFEGQESSATYLTGLLSSMASLAGGFLCWNWGLGKRILEPKTICHILSRSSIFVKERHKDGGIEAGRRKIIENSIMFWPSRTASYLDMMAHICNLSTREAETR